MPARPPIVSIVVIAAALAASACYRSWARTSDADVDPGPDAPALCGNLVVDPGEECDGDTSVCTGQDECPGLLVCRTDCTWADECLSPGFGILAGPTIVSTGVSFTEVSRTSLAFTGERYGVFWSGRRADVPGAPWVAWFTPVAPDASVDGESHSVMPDTFPISDIHAVWHGPQHNFGMAMIQDPSGGLIVSEADEDGWLLVDPGIGITDRGSGQPFISEGVASSRDYGLVWVSEDTRRVLAADLRDDFLVYWTMTLHESSVEWMHWLPSIIPSSDVYRVLWHVEEPEVGRSHLEFQQISSAGIPVADPVVLFDDIQVRPPSAIAQFGSGYAVIFATQPRPDAVVLEQHLAFLDPSGAVLVDPVVAGSVRRGALRDADLANGPSAPSECGVLAATPTGNEDVAPRVLVFARFDAGGARIGEPLQVTFDGDASTISMVNVNGGGGYAASYAISHDGVTDVGFVLLGCIPPD